MTYAQLAEHNSGCAHFALEAESELHQDCGFLWYLQMAHYYAMKAEMTDPIPRDPITKPPAVIPGDVPPPPAVPPPPPAWPPRGDVIVYPPPDDK